MESVKWKPTSAGWKLFALPSSHSSEWSGARCLPQGQIWIGWHLKKKLVLFKGPMLSYKPHFTWFTPVWVWRKREEVFQSLPLPSVVKDLQTQNLRVLWHGTNNTLQKEFQSPWPKVASFLHSLQVSWRWTLAKGSAETNERKSNLEQATLSDAALIANAMTAGLSNYVFKILKRK